MTTTPTAEGEKDDGLSVSQSGSALHGAPSDSAPSAPDEIEVWVALGEAYGAMGAAFQRIHSLPRTEDSALAERLGRARGRIERLKAARSVRS